METQRIIERYWKWYNYLCVTKT